MEREEPRIARPDLSGIEFREPIRINPIPAENHSLWWQIAIGVFLALLAHSIIIGAYRRHEINIATRQLNAEMKKAGALWEREAQAAQAAVRQAATPYSAPPTRSRPEPLQDGQRCIQGRRFQRVDNGWVHLPNQAC